ncbi:PREDICTED: uncharacterized protein LOC104776656 [Camelina sativa]|uniref:Uncharacterized protein LOC104776656 n=1 Tax=Camelina sativa TaxID=90675 RepID=A0ABM0YCT1_CAMSA|nr:PREDICTED: uncharacterized protein LOC104776656 [Camelina sativa]
MAQHPIPPIVNIAQNLQYKDHPQADKAVLDALEASTQDWLTAPQWLTLFQNAQLFDPENSFNIPAEEEGLYRVDNNHMQDRNTWLIRSAQSSCSQMIHEKNKDGQKNKNSLVLV